MEKQWKIPEEQLPTENCWAVAMMVEGYLKILFYYAKEGHFIADKKVYNNKIITYFILPKWRDNE